ncbi:MAG TPA: CHAT domain-containing protein [Lacibacter sp.]|nr:CHAT domain-containing protein [Lacibacter sp.]
MKRFILITFSLFLYLHLTAQDSASIATSFNKYYRSSVEKLRNLYMVRGATFVCDADGTNKNFLAEIDDFLSEYGTVKKLMGVLFYSHQNDTLRTWLYKNGKLYFASQAITAEQLIEREFELRYSLNVTRMVSKRTVTIRGSEPEVTSGEKPMLLQDAIRQTTDLLLPAAIRKNLSNTTHLIIIPEFNIGQFPFHLLKPFDNDQYLADRISYSFAPHLCNLKQFSAKNDGKIGKANSLQTSEPFIVGNPSFSKSGKYNLPDLPAAEIEAVTVAGVLKSKAYTGKTAAADSLVLKASTADLIYLATHGYFNFEKILDGSFLAFTPDQHHPEGLLTARQIQELKLKAEMAILSACQTGYGKVVPGGFIGLARAFYKAGVDFTVMSLWSVDDEKTKELMLLFLEELQEPSYFYPASNLRKAIKRFKEKNPDPVYWAPFSVFGFTY